jgi:hypothetical protein
MRLIVNRILPLVVIQAACLLGTASCSKSSNNNSGSESMTASVNNNAWTANYAVAGSYTVAISGFDIVGTQIKSGDTTGFSMTFYSPITVNKAINSDTTSSIDIQYVDGKTGALYDGGLLAGHSILTVTSYDSSNFKIGGTFSGVLYNVNSGTDSVTVTGGTFSTSFTLQ